MTQLEMLEIIKQHHDHMGEVEARKLINRALADFAAKTEILESTITTTTAINQRYYSLPDNLLKVTSVWFNDTQIPKLIGKPIIDDDTEETG